MAVSVFSQTLIQSVDNTGTVPGSENTETVVEATVDILGFVAGALLGVVIGLLITVIIMSVSHVFGRWYKYYQPVHHAIRRPTGMLLATLGGWIGFLTVKDKIEDDHAPGWLDWLNHGLIILFIVLAAALIVAFVNGLVKSIYLRMEVSSEERASRIETQVQVIHRVVSAVIWVLAFGAVLLTFPAARTAGTSS